MIVVSDSFNRTVSSSWGSADVGGSWTINQSGGTVADYAVSGGTATMANGGTSQRHRILIGSGLGNPDLYVTTSSPVVATGAAIESAIFARYTDTNNTYYGGVQFQTDGSILGIIVKRVGGVQTTITSGTIAGLTYVANTQVRIRFTLAGSSLLLKVWAASGSEPAAYNITGIDASLTSGQVGLTTVLNGGNTNTTPVAVAYANFSASIPGVPLLANQLSNARLQVRIAWGANLTADPATWLWSDVTSDVWQGGNNGINISPMGRSPQTTNAQPAGCTVRLKNPNGQYTPYNPGGSNYPNVRLGTPVQVRVSLDGGSTWSIRFQGEAASWAPGWDAQGKFAYVTLTAAGITRRLGSGSKPIQSALYRAVTKASTLPTAYWPCEDGADGLALSSAVSPIAGVPPMVAVGASNFASTDGAPGSGPQPSFTAGGSLIGAVPGSASVTQWRVQAAWKANTIDAGGFAVPLQWATADGNAWELDLNPSALVFSETIAFTSPSAAATVDDGLWHEGRVTAVQNGGNIDIKVYFDGVQVISESIAGTVTRVVEVQANSAASASSILAGIGQFIVWNGTITISGLDTVDSMHGHAGETASARLTRLTTEEGIPFSLTGTSDTAMGAQSVDTIFNLLRECEAADLGYLLDGFGPGLSYTCRSSLYNQTAQVTVDANSGQIPATPGPLPSHDSQWIRNRVTVTRTNGAIPTTTEDTSGALGTANVGVFDNRYLVNVEADSQLLNIGSWLVHLGTVEGLRYTQFPLDFAASPELASTWIGAVPTDRFDLTNLSSQLTQHPPETASVLVEGWSEFLNATAWRITVNCSNYQPWNVYALDTNFPLELDGQTLNSNLAAGATSLSLATAAGKPLFTTAAADYPIDLKVAGWRVHAVAAGVVLNTNPFFESGIANWTATGGSAIASSGTQHHDGSLALRITPNGTSANPGAASDEAAVTVGVTYNYAIWVWLTASTSYQVGIEWHTAAHAFISQSITTLTPATGTWTLFTGSGAAPATAAFGVLIAKASGTPASSNIAYIDQALLTNPATGASSPQTLAIDPSQNTSTISSGATVTLWQSPVLGL